jgi:hypothetical protein
VRSVDSGIAESTTAGNADQTQDAFGEDRVREVMLGSAVVALIVGWSVGRRHERVGRSRRDYVAAKTTMEKAAKIAGAELRKAILSFLAVGTVMLALFIAAVNLNR